MVGAGPEDRGRQMNFRTIVLDTPFLTRRAWEGGGTVAAMAGATLSTVLRLQREYQPLQIVLATEARGADAGRARREMNADYKGKRTPPPPEYIEGQDTILAMAPLMGLYVASSSTGFEADDCFAAIAATWPGPILGWASDKDWLISVGPGVHLQKADCSQRPRDVDPENWHRPADLLITAENCMRLTGLSPHGWWSYLCLHGDASDGIAGVSKIGDGRAKGLLAACPDLVSLLVEGEGWALPETLASIREQVATRAPRLLVWAEHVIQHRYQLVTAASLVTPQITPMEVVEPCTGPDSLQQVAVWLDSLGLGSMMERVARDLCPSDEVDMFDCELPDDPGVNW